MRDSMEQGPIFHIQNPTPFADSRDYKILINDWPYGLEEGIVHVVVWLKNRLAVDTTNDKGDLEWRSRILVESFVKKMFVEKLGEGAEDKVMWFRNWTGLQSVRGIDHIHVLVRGVRRETVEELIKARVPTSP